MGRFIILQAMGEQNNRAGDAQEGGCGGRLRRRKGGKLVEGGWEVEVKVAVVRE